MREILTKRYLAIAVEPIHIGSQSELMASTTARDVDGFPFIPASSLKGCIRSLSSSRFKFEGCDGKGWHCPQPHKCPSCSIFGFANVHSGTASSLVRFSSASMVLVPIKSEYGIFWLSSWNRLSKTGIASEPSQYSKNNWAFGEQIRNSQVEWLAKLLGEDSDAKAQKTSTSSWVGPHDLKETYERTIVLDENSLSSLISYFTGLSTSISIDGHTGGARDGALFGVEHINRMSVLCFEIIFINPIVRGIREFVNSQNPNSVRIPADIEHVENIIQDGLEKLKFYGIGGKRSRGYGRLKTWELPSIENQSGSEHQLSTPHQNSIPLVFISYSSKDVAIARRLVTDLQSEQIDVWLDEKKILVGDSIYQKIEEGISNCDYLVVLLSQESMQSQWVKDEISAASVRERHQRRTILLPAILSGVELSSLPALLGDKKFARFTPKYEDGLLELVEAIRAHANRKLKEHNKASSADAKSRAAD